jgi:hypothetical protein
MCRRPASPARAASTSSTRLPMLRESAPHRPAAPGRSRGETSCTASQSRPYVADLVLREDAGFHSYQMLEAGVRQFTEWEDTDAGRHILIAVARYLAAHSPTERAALQTADIARRLMRGGELHQGEGASS